MVVWIPDSEASVQATPFPTIFSTATVTTSRGTNRSAINDLHEATSSADESSFFHWWPKKGSLEWVEYKLKAPATVSEAQVYWFDDTGHGECRVPQSWKLFYRVAGSDAWTPVETSDAYGVALDQYNTVKFKPVTATEFRLEVQLQADWSAGIEQWKLK